ncbi:O-antigen ligase family protein [Anaerococcus hydrogenalis]|uniref:O-antigen ligase family protein n=1 Tax=Anaerococcus hydrogenalis TaxID=33029 RepID=UPI001D425A51|nr:O-antigen ligase family protein [Anaerococcus hydrogenalis]MBS5989423.1 O-antigen ligase family protein [Anaerococcus hydrogenalis]
MKIKINLKYLINLLILIPFLYPKGFEVYNDSYKKFFTVWLYISLIIIIIKILSSMFNKKLKTNSSLVFFLLYYLFMFIITLGIKHSISNGLQKIFAAPLLVMFIYMELSDDSSNLIKAINKILTVSFLLGLTIFNPIFWGNYFIPADNHIFFWGHVQVGAQIGLLSLLFSYLEYESSNKEKKYKLYFRILLIILMCIQSRTSMSYLMIGVMLSYVIIHKYISFKTKGKSYVNFYLLFNLILFLIIRKNGLALNLGKLSLNGRGFIWNQAIYSFLDKPIFGHGVHGVLIKVFWSDWVGGGTGLNYMHNQMLQILNDGGILLFVLFLALLYSVASNIDGIKNNKIRSSFYIFLLIILLIMTFESALEYFYIVVAISTLTSLKNIDLDKNIVKLEKKT